MTESPPIERDRLGRPKGRKSIYAYQDKTTMNVGTDVVKFIQSRRLPEDRSLEDALRRLIGMTPRPKKERA